MTTGRTLREYNPPLIGSRCFAPYILPSYGTYRCVSSLIFRVCLSYMNISATEIQPSLSETRPVLDKMLNISAEIFFFLFFFFYVNERQMQDLLKQDSLSDCSWWQRHEWKTNRGFHSRFISVFSVFMIHISAT